jgi:2-polyprenyl-3-methyl-5-hydroxy-6-metoxy-1,4-benzoquinol methylase
MSTSTGANILDRVPDAPGSIISKRDLRRSASRWRDIWKAPLHDFPIRDEILCHYLSFSPDMNVLEIGPGSGFTAFWLSRLVAEMTIVDVTPEVVADLRQQLQSSSNLHYGSVNLAHNELVLRIGRRFDVAFALDVFEYVEDPEFGLRNLADVLLPNGQLFLSFPNVMPPEGDGVTYFRSRQDVETLIEKAGFRRWQIFSVRQSKFSAVIYQVLHNWPLEILRAVRKSSHDGRPQTYESTWAFKKRAQLSRTKFLLHLYWTFLGWFLRLGGPVFTTEPPCDDLLGRQLVIHAWK